MPGRDRLGIKPYSNVDNSILRPFRASSLMYSPTTLCRNSLKPGNVLGLSSRYVRAISTFPVSDISALSFSTAVAYSVGSIKSLSVDSWEESPIAGITASAIAIKVVHCESVRTSPLGGGGSGLSKGAMISRANVVILKVVCIVGEKHVQFLSRYDAITCWLSGISDPPEHR